MHVCSKHAHGACEDEIALRIVDGSQPVRALVNGCRKVVGRREEERGASLGALRRRRIDPGRLTRGDGEGIRDVALVRHGQTDDLATFVVDRDVGIVGGLNLGVKERNTAG